MVKEKFVSLRYVHVILKKHKLNSLTIGGRSIGPLVGGWDRQLPVFLSDVGYIQGDWVLVLLL